jgi:hypothetical protein
MEALSPLEFCPQNSKITIKTGKKIAIERERKGRAPTSRRRLKKSSTNRVKIFA